MADVGNSLVKALDYVYGRSVDRLAGLSDGEYFWEPVPGCWSVRQGKDGRWAMDGGPPPHEGTSRPTGHRPPPLSLVPTPSRRRGTAQSSVALASLTGG